MNPVRIRLWLAVLTVMLSLATLKGQTIALSNVDPNGSPDDTFDGTVFQSGNQYGDANIYAILSAGAKSFQIVSPGESLTKTVSSTGYFTIRTASNIVVDKSKILNFSGTVTGSVAITVKPLSVTTLSTNVSSETTPGSELTISYQTGAGTFPPELIVGKFKAQLLDANGNLLSDLLNSTDQYTGAEKVSSSRGNIRFIKAIIPVFTPAGTYRVRVITQGLTTQVSGSVSGQFTIRDNPPIIGNNGVSSSSFCAGTSVSFPFSTTGVFASGNLFKVRLIDGSGTTLQDLVETSATSPIRAILPSTLAKGSYRFLIASTTTNVVSTTSTINVTALPTMTLSGSTSIIAGSQAAVQVNFTGTPPWSVDFTDYRSDVAPNYVRTITTSSSSTSLNPTLFFTSTYDKSFIKGFKDSGCGTSDVINGSSQIIVTPLTITTGNLSGTYCPGSVITVPFTTNSQLPTDAICQVQLSDSNGNFQNGTVIGTGNRTSPISATLSQSLTPGAGYRILVIAQKPSSQSAINYTDAINSTSGSLIVSRPDAPKVTDLYFCSGTILSPLTAIGTNLKWYSEVNGQPLSDAPTPLNDRSSRYFVSQTVNGCESSQSTLNVYSKAIPSAPSLTNVTLCQGAQGQFSTSISGAQWYTSVTGGVGSAQPPTLNSQAAGDQIVYVTQTVDGCESTRAAVKATVYAIPAAPIVQTPTPLCQFAVANALTATGQNLTWYDQSGKLNGAPVPETSVSGTKSYSVSQKVNGCESPRAQIDQIIRAIPITPTTASVRFCVGDTPRSLTATGSNLKWYTAATGGAGASASPTFFTDTPGVLTFYVTQTDNNSCESQRQPISVTVVALPSAPSLTNVTLCQGAQGQFSTSISGALWYTSATGGVGSAQPPTLNSQAAGDQVVYVTQTVNGCESPRAAVKATVYAIPTAPTFQTPAPLCQYATAIALTAVGQNLTWYDQFGKLNGAPVPETSASGTKSYSVSQNVNGCESALAQINQAIRVAPTTPTATSVRFCVGELPRSLTATGSTIKWYTNSTGGAGTSTSPAFLTETPNVLTFYVTQTDNNNCESLRLPISVSVVAPPAAPTVSTSQVVCQFAKVSSLTASPNTGLVWQGSGITGSSDIAPTPATTQPATYTYLVSQKAGTCTSMASTITFTVRKLPDAPKVVSPATFCIGQTSSVLSATADGQLTWYENVDHSGSASSQIVVNTNRASATTFFVTQTDNFKCESQNSIQDVRVSTKATARLTGDGEIYPGDSTAIRVRLTGDGPWSFTNWNKQVINTMDSLYVKWERPTTTRSFAITNLTSACGVGDILNSYTLLVRTPLGTQSIVEPLLLKAYPNPTTGDVSVEWSSPTKQEISLQIVNIEGKIIKQVTRQATNVLQTELFQLGNQPTGTYILRVTSHKNGVLARPILKH